MDAANGTVQPPDLRAVGEVLRPAFLLWLIYQCAWGAYYLAGSYVGHSERADMVLLVGHLVVTVLAAAVIFLFARRDRAACRVFAPLRKGRLELCLLSGVVGALLLAGWQGGVRSWAPSDLPEERAGWPLPVALLVVAVMPGVFEELLFRGVILQRLRRVLTLPMSIAVQAMLFSTIHLDGPHLLPFFVFGCLSGFLCVVAGALWPSMLFHTLWSGWLVLGDYGWL